MILLACVPVCACNRDTVMWHISGIPACVLVIFFYPILTPEIALYITLLFPLYSQQWGPTQHIFFWLFMSPHVLLVRAAVLCLQSITGLRKTLTLYAKTWQSQTSFSFWLRRMSDFVTLKVSKGKTHCFGTVSVRYTYNPQRRLITKHAH